MDGLTKLAQHGELRTLEFMPWVKFDIDTLRTILDGNPHLTLLLLPKETVSEECQKLLPYVSVYMKWLIFRSLLIENEIRINIKPPSREFELSMRQRLPRPPMMRIMW